jgi:hypothetical protein
MSVKAELAGFLAHLPAVDGPDERKALLTYTGPSELGIYLDWQGSNMAFTERLLEELSRRGKGALVGFLGALPKAPQVEGSVDRQQELAALRAQVGTLDEAGFAAEFPVPLPAGAPAPKPQPDPGLLAAAVVGEVLVPYYELGAGPLGQKAGGHAAQVAAETAERIEAAFGESEDARDILAEFKTQPRDNQALLTRSLKRKLAGDAALATEMAGLYSSATAQPEAAGLQTLIDVSQEIGVVRGDVVGAVVGADVLDRIRRVSVAQKIDTVGAGATVVGAVSGGSGPINIGGEHIHGDRIDTGGAPYIGGGLHVGGDFVGRDQVVHGDEVRGDKITMGDVTDSTLAVGRGARVHVQEAMSATDLATAFRAVTRQIEDRPADPEVDQDELQDTAQRVKDEVLKGDAASETKVERWLKTLIDVAPDVAEVALAALTNPLVGVAVAIRTLAQRLKASLG